MNSIAKAQRHILVKRKQAEKLYAEIQDLVQFL